MTRRPTIKAVSFWLRSINTSSTSRSAFSAGSPVRTAFAYVWTAFIETPDPKWANLARQEIKRSQELNPQLAETHLANGLLLFSAYEGFQNDAAIRELSLQNNSIQTVATVNWQPYMDTSDLKIWHRANHNEHSILIRRARVLKI